LTTRVSLTCVLLLLASCAREPEQPPQADTADATSSAAAEAPAGESQEAQAGSPQPDGFFVGRWAADVAYCNDPWVITEKSLHTPGEVVCQFDRVNRTARGAEAEATCTAEGPPQHWTLQFSYAQSAHALLIEDGPFADIGLVRCENDTPVSPPAPGTPGGLPDDRTPVSEAPFSSTSAQGAANVLQTYYGLLAAGRYDEAWRLWTQGGEGSGMTADEFSKSFAQYESYNANIGAPGRIEGAAGSLYVSVPVQIYGRRKTGEEVHLLGEATLRRVNDVPGSTPEQRAWHIFRIDVHPSPGHDPQSH